MAASGIKDTNFQLHTIPLFHVNGWGTPHTITGSGARHVVLRKFDPTEVLDIIQRERVTHFSMVPTMAVALLNHPKASAYDLSSVEFVAIGGTASPAGVI